MVKRSNEFGQMRKEDYDEMEASGGNGGTGGSQGFQRASDEVLRKRRLVQASGKATRTPEYSGNNPFSKLNMAPGSSSSTAAAAPAAFSFPSFATPASFAAAPTAPLDSSAPRGSSISILTESSQEVDKKKVRYAASFRDFLLNSPVRTVDNRPFERFLTTYASLRRNRNLVTVQTKDDNVASTAANSGFRPTTAASAATGFNFGNSMSSNGASMTGAPVGFNFGGAFNSAAQVPAPASTPSGGGFTYGQPQTTTDTANASQPTFGGFSTTVAPTVSAQAAAPPASSGTGDEDENPVDKPEDVLENPDADFETKYKVSVKVYKLGDKSKRGPKYRGDLKLERNKRTGKCQAVVRDPNTGKVQFVVGITKGMPIGDMNIVKQGKQSTVGRIDFQAVETDKPENFAFAVAEESAHEFGKQFKEFAARAN